MRLSQGRIAQITGLVLLVLLPGSGDTPVLAGVATKTKMFPSRMETSESTVPCHEGVCPLAGNSTGKPSQCPTCRNGNCKNPGQCRNHLHCPRCVHERHGKCGRRACPDRKETAHRRQDKVCNRCRQERCETNYWVISSRDCRQRFGLKRAASCYFDVFHATSNCYPRESCIHEFASSLQPGVPVLIVVHGSWVPWENLLTDAYQTYHWIRNAAPDRPLNVVFFTWPSDTVSTHLAHIDVAILGRRAGFNGHYLSQMIQHIPSQFPVCLMGHSHGGRAVASALHLMGGGEVQGKSIQAPEQRIAYDVECQPELPNNLRAIFVAAAFDHHWLNPDEKYGKGLCPVEAVLNVTNPKDLALRLYAFRKPFGDEAIGATGFTRKNRSTYGWMNAKAREVDVSKLLGFRHKWPHYNRRPEISCALVPYIFFTDMTDESGVLKSYQPPKTSPENPSGRQKLRLPDLLHGLQPTPLPLHLRHEIPKDNTSTGTANSDLAEKRRAWSVLRSSVPRKSSFGLQTQTPTSENRHTKR